MNTTWTAALDAERGSLSYDRDRGASENPPSNARRLQRVSPVAGTQ